MRITSLIMAASAAGMVSAYPKRDMKKRDAGFNWFGVSESGAEFGQTNIPGTLGTDYTWPETSKIQSLRKEGMNIFRVPFLMERLVPSKMTGTPDSTYLKDLKTTVSAITDSGAYAVLDPHNYGRYSGSIISSTSDFKAFWKTVAGEFASNDKVIFDTNNEFHDMDQDLVLNLNQAAINGIRAAGAKTQYIFVEGNSYSGAWKWATTNDNLKDLTDPQDKIVYEMHQYLDSDGSGTSETCTSSTVGKERLQTATEWLQSNKKKGFLGEFAGGVNADCESAVEGLLSYMSDNTDVWTGAEWWSAGPWWGSYMYSLEPETGPAYDTYLPILKKYFVGGSASSSASASATASASSGSSATASVSSAASTTTAAAAAATTAPVSISAPTAQYKAPAPTTSAVQSSGASAVPASSASSSFQTRPASTSSVASVSCGAATSSSAAPTPSGSAGVVPHYYQCGGINWKGSTQCESGYTCKKQNPYYHQCV
ncbi:putative extracellular endoglucanase/cellulase [Aspergillus affinis]|uniref:putative extracellular endoglucanase/cellulase n=1 Tax=Aspergillus affinis TaxID=1070780 RepID=UPI0022FEB7ED|nr:glycoside hydrolase [Aspergillus affinis]KAI9037989.1 glycoside hydrolase [Aspergillus affinis]